MKKIKRKLEIKIWLLTKLNFIQKFWYVFCFFISRFGAEKLEEIKSINQIPEKLEYGTFYKRNGFINFMAHPGKVQKYLNHEVNYRHFDSDDHASYWCGSLLKNNLAPKVYLAVVYMLKTTNLHEHGHAVCLFQDENNLYWYGDYNHPIFIGEDMWDFARKIAQTYSCIPTYGSVIKVTKLDKHDIPILGIQQSKNFLEENENFFHRNEELF